MATASTKLILGDPVPRSRQSELVEASKAIHDQLRETLLGEVKNLIASELKGTEYELGIRLGRALEEKAAKVLEAELQKGMGSLISQFEERVKHLQEIYEGGLAQQDRLIESLVTAIKSLPRPVVNIPDQQAPTVNVTVPQAQPVINVQPAEIKAGDTIVNVPPARKIVKNISYDEYNRPAIIQEQEI